MALTPTKHSRSRLKVECRTNPGGRTTVATDDAIEQRLREDPDGQDVKAASE
jgi:hypothetical protein